MKDKIKQWLDGKYSVSLTLDSREEVIDLIAECFNDLAPQWVSVNDRLPIERTDGAHVQVSVLATDGENVCQINFHSGCTPTDWSEWSEYGDIEPALITHWQPLPLPPSDGE